MRCGSDLIPQPEGEIVASGKLLERIEELRQAGLHISILEWMGDGNYRIETALGVNPLACRELEKELKPMVDASFAPERERIESLKKEVRENLS